MYPHTYNNSQYRVDLSWVVTFLTHWDSIRTSLLALRARALAKFGEVDTVPVSENSFNVAKQYAYCRATRSLFSKIW